MRALQAVPILVAAIVGIAGAARPAAADALPSGVFDRIVAVVGRDIILLSDVHAREVPFLKQLEGDSSPDVVKLAKRMELEKELVTAMIDERLEATYAAAHHITVAPDDVDRAEAAVAQQNSMSVDQLEEVAVDHGMTRAAYRAELARQVLGAKLVQIVIKPRVHADPKLSEADLFVLLDQERGHWREELRRATHVDVRL
jgi:parvulin-like peptidyl-prolyl isomerase